MNYKIFLLVLSSILFLSHTVVCQNSKDVSENRAPSDRSNKVFTLKRSSKRKSAIDKDIEKRAKKSASRKGVFGTEHDAHEDFEKRMKKVGRENMKEERLMKKPRYSDPTYFGHKKKPKIRPVGKKKVCKECGLKH